jgi:hypothetical protein
MLKLENMVFLMEKLFLNFSINSFQKHGQQIFFKIIATFP